MHFFITTICCIIIMLLHGHAHAQQPKVLIISSYDLSYEWASECVKGIKETLDDFAELKYFFMDTKRIPEAEFTTRADQAWDMFLSEHPDLVMVGDDNALRLLGPRLGDTSTPVVYYGINNNPRFYFKKIPANITGVLERTPVLPLMRYIRQISPKAKSILVLLDKSHTSSAYVETIFKNRNPLKIGGMEMTYIISENWPMWQQNVRTMAPFHDILLAVTYQSVKRKDGSHVNLHEIIEWTSANSPVPLFSTQEFTVYDKGSVGAFVTVGDLHGKQAAAMALKILRDGIKPQNITPETDRNVSLFLNFKQLKRFNLTLPEEVRETAHFL